jgi:hypothetical protein
MEFAMRRKDGNPFICFPFHGQSPFTRTTTVCCGTHLVSFPLARPLPFPAMRPVQANLRSPFGFPVFRVHPFITSIPNLQIYPLNSGKLSVYSALDFPHTTVDTINPIWIFLFF